MEQIEVLKNNYNIPSNNRELQLSDRLICKISHYNIPSNNRELQPVSDSPRISRIITYQVITGNYSRMSESDKHF